MYEKKIGKYSYDNNYIGKGSFSKVYTGIDEQNNKYAIKKIYKKNDSKYINLVEKEIEVMEKLNHKNIEKLYDKIYTDKHIFLIMELCDNDLNSYIKNNILSEDVIKDIMKQLIEVLKYIMDNNIVHRDLKPHNILINKDVHFDLKVDINNISNLIKDYTHVVITSALDDFIASDQKLEWRGIKSKTKLYEDLDESECITEAYQINHPSLEENYTRTIETKHASGQRVKASIVQEEYAYPNIRHYPVYRSGTNVFDDNDKFKNQIINEISRPVYFAGRLANYKYINQDEAILDGFRAARKILKA